MVKGNIGICFDISYIKGYIKLKFFELIVFLVCEVFVKIKFKI